MSSSSSSSSSSFGVFADSTECSICLEVLTKPVSLPCRHVFCLTCLQKYAVHSNKRPGDCLSCPICRRELVIPNRNFSAFIVTAEDNCRTDDGRHAVISRHSSSPSNRTGAAASQHQWQNNGETSNGIQFVDNYYGKKSYNWATYTIYNIINAIDYSGALWATCVVNTPNAVSNCHWPI